MRNKLNYLKDKKVFKEKTRLEKIKMKTVLITILCLVTINCGHTLIIADQKKKMSIKCHENIEPNRLAMGFFFGIGYIVGFDDIVGHSYDDRDKVNGEDKNVVFCRKKTKEYSNRF